MMSHDFQTTVDGAVGELLWLPFPEDATGLALVDLADLHVSVNGSPVADPVADLGLQIFEVDSVNQPGMYFLRLTPDTPGTLFLRFLRTTFRYEYTVNVVKTFAVDTTEGDYTITVQAGAVPIEGATVRLYNVAGTTLIQRGTTDSSGEVTFYGLPLGTYQVRAYAEGVDLQDVNPTTITVTPNAENSPIIDELLPDTASIGDVIAISGRFFDAVDSEVLFGVGTPVAADYINAAGTLLLVTVPAGLTDTIIPVRVVKPDPNNLPSGTLQSDPVNMVRV